MDEKRKVRSTVEDKCEKIKQVLRKKGAEAIKTIIYDFYVFNCNLFGTPKMKYVKCQNNDNVTIRLKKREKG